MFYYGINIECQHCYNTIVRGSARFKGINIFFSFQVDFINSKYLFLGNVALNYELLILENYYLITAWWTIPRCGKIKYVIPRINCLVITDIQESKHHWNDKSIGNK